MDTTSRKEAIKDACSSCSEAFYNETGDRALSRSDMLAGAVIAVIALLFVYLGYLV